MVIKDQTGNGLTVNSISSQLESGTLTIEIDSPDLFPDAKVEIQPSDPELIRIKNRGKWYNHPWCHLKERIDDLHPVSIATLAHQFYSSYISEAEFWLDKK